MTTLQGDSTDAGKKKKGTQGTTQWHVKAAFFLEKYFLYIYPK